MKRHHYPQFSMPLAPRGGIGDDDAMSISFLLTALALCHAVPTHISHPLELAVPSASYSSLSFPDPSPNLDIQLPDSMAQPPSATPAQNSQVDTQPQPESQAARQRTSYVSPTSNTPEVLRTFAPPAVRWGAGHRGVDVAMEIGSEVVAAGDGVVIYAGKINDRFVVSIEHSDGIRTTYEPVTPSVKKGDTVTAGQVIGTLDEGHCDGRSCLHWGAKRGKDAYIDPLSLLKARRIRLIE